MKRALAVAFACVLMHCCLFILQTHAQEVHAIKPITDDMLYKLTYPGPKDMDSIKNVKFIKNGMYTSGKVGSINYYNSRIINRAFGDLNGDGVNDAALIAGFNTGGSGGFICLYAVIAAKGNILITEPISLGDRVNIEDVKITSGKIILKILKHKPNDPLCCPTLKTTLTYTYQGGRLVGP